MSANTLKFKLHASNLFGPDLSLEKGSKLKHLEFKEDAADLPSVVDSSFM